MAIGLLGRAGRAPLDCVRSVTREEMFLWMKGIVLDLLSALRVRDVRMTPQSAAGFEQEWALQLVVDGMPVGCLGLLDPAISGKWRIMEPLAVAEFSRSALLQHVFDIPTAGQISPFPSVLRDLALIVDAKVPNQDILACIQDVRPPELTHVSLFDIFVGEGMGAGKRSLAYRFVYRSMERSLTDERVNEYQDNIRNALKERFDLEIREG